MKFRKVTEAMRFTNPKDFMLFVQLYMLDAVNGKGPVFVRHTEGKKVYREDELYETPRGFEYSAFCKIGDKHITAELSSFPDLPTNGWKFSGQEQRIGWTTDSKKELFAFLKSQGVSDETQLKDLKTVKVQNLRELIDASSEEWREVTTREKIEPKLSYSIKSQMIGREKLDVSIRASPNRSDALTFMVTADYSKEFAKHHQELNAALEKFQKFQVVHLGE